MSMLLMTQTSKMKLVTGLATLVLVVAFIEAVNGHTMDDMDEFIDQAQEMVDTNSMDMDEVIKQALANVDKPIRDRAVNGEQTDRFSMKKETPM